MALQLTGGDSDRISHGSGASIDNFSELSFLLWAYISSIPPNVRRFFFKSPTDFEKELSLGSTGQVSTAMDTDGTDVQATSENSAGNIVTANSWWFIALTVSSGLVPRLYLGTLSAPVYEVAYASQTAGTGSPVSDAAGDLVVGNVRTLNRSTAMHAAYASYWNRALSLGELAQQQYRPTPGNGCRMFSVYGYNGTGTQPDYSGNGNHGTVTGATVADHVPIPFRRIGQLYVPHVVAAPAGPRIPIQSIQMWRSPFGMRDPYAGRPAKSRQRRRRRGA